MPDFDGGVVPKLYVLHALCTNKFFTSLEKYGLTSEGLTAFKDQYLENHAGAATLAEATQRFEEHLIHRLLRKVSGFLKQPPGV